MSFFWQIYNKYIPFFPHPQKDSVNATRYQTYEVCVAFEELAATTNDSLAKSNAQSLINEMRNYKFLMTLVFSHLFHFQVKEVQSETIDVTTAEKTV